MAGNWINTTLGAVCELRAGSVFPPALQGKSMGAYPFMKVSDMNLAANATSIQGANNWVDDEDFPQLKAKPFPAGTTVFAKIGEALKANRLRYLVRPTIIDNNVMGAVPAEEIVDARFFFYALSQFDFGEVAGGTALPYLTVGALSQLEIALPPLPEQRAIAHILGTLDDKIELNRQMSETLEAMARALFKSWFVDFAPVRAKMEGRDPGLPQPLADLFPVRLVDSELGEIPDGWEVGPLSVLAELMIGGDWGREAAQDGDVLARCLRGVDIDRIRNTGWSDAPLRFLSSSSLEKRAPSGVDVLVEGSGECGRAVAAQFLEQLYAEPIIYSNFCKRFRCPSPGSAFYVEFLLNELVRTGEMKNFVTGTAMPNLDHKGILTAHWIVAPPPLILEAFGSFASSARRRLYWGESRTLAALRDTLLPKLISGELRVKDAEEFVGRLA